MQIQSTKWLEILPIICILTLAGLLRIHGLERQSLWSDELFIVNLSYANHIKDIMPWLMGDTHPPGYGIFMYLTLPIIGYQDWQIRLHSLIGGLIAVYLTYRIGKKYFSSPQAMLAATLMACSYQAIYYSQEARAYSLLSAVVLINVNYFLTLFSCLANNNNRRIYLGFVVSGIFCVYLHYSGVVYIACSALVAMILCLYHCPGGIKKLMLAYFPILLLYCPWIPIMYKQMIGIPSYWGGNVQIGIDEVDNLLLFFSGPDFHFRNWMLGLLAIGTLVSCVKIVYRQTSLLETMNARNFFTVLLLCVSPILVFYLKSVLTSQTVFQDRHFIYSIPMFALLCSYGPGEIISRVKSPKVALMIVTILCVLTASLQIRLNSQSGLYTTYTKDRLREAIQQIANDHEFMSQHERPIFSSLSTHFYHYQRQYGITYTSMYEHFQTVEAYQDFLKRMNGKNNLVFYYVGLGDPTRFGFYSELLAHHEMQCMDSFESMTGSVFLTRFSMSGSTKKPQQPVTSSCRVILKAAAPS